MSKIYLIGDTHIGLGYPNNVDKWYKVHKEYFDKFLIPLLKKEIKPGDIIVHLGDLFDNRNIIPINLLNYGMDIVEEIAKIAPLHIIIGNHDLWSKSASEVNSVRPFKYIPNVSVYDKTSILEYNGLKILMMPYIETKKEQISLIKQFNYCDYLFCHSDLNGCKMHLTSVAHKNTDKIDVEDFSSFKKVYSGHIHIVQRSKNFNFVGSIFQMDRNDYGDQKGIFVLDTDTGEENFIENKVSPIFKKFRVTNEDDIEQLDNLKLTNDYIDLSISNSLLISNRKLRRKLEVILESNSFSSIEYLDDIVEKVDVESEVELKVDSESIDISIQLDYADYIKEYILKQKYDSSNFKDGLLSEYDQVIDIYNEGYRNKKKE